jgi:hypothetical protein
MPPGKGEKHGADIRKFDCTPYSGRRIANPPQLTKLTQRGQALPPVQPMRPNGYAPSARALATTARYCRARSSIKS